ncbi:MAG: RbsD/FucU domain-containing protein [Dermatophilaceae bacterium]
MLKSIPAIITPELLYSMALMGHGDILAIVDRNYPSHSVKRPVHHLSGVDTTTAAEAILSLFPVDDFLLPSAFRMTPDGEPNVLFPAHESFQQSLRRCEGREIELQGLERTKFYALATAAFAVVQTTDDRPFSCFLVTKGVVAQ